LANKLASGIDRFRTTAWAGSFWLAVVAPKALSLKMTKLRPYILKLDLSFQQELSQHGNVAHATGTWPRVGEGGMALSKEFLTVSGQEPGADGTGMPTSKKICDFAFSSSSSMSRAVIRQGRFPLLTVVMCQRQPATIR
jgi:hypothetical protein